MADDNYFIERREDGDYVVKKANAERASAVTETQAEAIAKAKAMNPNATIRVERVRNTSNGSRDKWRKP